MKLAPITKQALLAAAEQLDVVKDKIWSEYWVHIPETDKEYPFKELVRRAYAHTPEGGNGELEFQSNYGYRNYIQKTFGFPIYFKVRDNIPFFTKADIEFFKEYAGKKYRKDNIADKQIGKRINETIFSPTDAWARALNLDGFEVHRGNIWQTRGVLASYSWYQIYRTVDKDKKIFFTVGVDPDEEALVYKLHCYYKSVHEENILSDAQQKVFKRIVDATDAKWQAIGASDLHNWNWERLVQKTREFIEFYTPLYNEVIAAVWKLPLPQTQEEKPLREQAIPVGIGVMPDRLELEFEGNADYEGSAKNQKNIGGKGEALVIAFEKAALIEAGRPDLAEKVKPVNDWEGFDILSYQPDEQPKQIEIKTTVGSCQRPFYWSWNQRQKIEQYQGSYWLYRLYNYDEQSNTADFFKIGGDILSAVLERPVHYEVYIK